MNKYFCIDQAHMNALMSVSGDGHRLWMDGIYVSRVQGKPTIVFSTNGTAMCLLHVNDYTTDAHSCYFRIAKCNRGKNPSPTIDGVQIYQDELVYSNKAGQVTIKAGDTPEWDRIRSIVPKVFTGQPSYFSPKMLGLISNAFTLVDDSKSNKVPVDFIHNGPDGPSMVTVAGHPEMVIIAMPMNMKVIKEERTTTLPDWLV